MWNLSFIGLKIFAKDDFFPTGIPKPVDIRNPISSIFIEDYEKTIPTNLFHVWDMHLYTSGFEYASAWYEGWKKAYTPKEPFGRPFKPPELDYFNNLRDLARYLPQFADVMNRNDPKEKLFIIAIDSEPYYSTKKGKVVTTKKFQCARNPDIFFPYYNILPPEMKVHYNIHRSEEQMYKQDIEIKVDDHPGLTLEMAVIMFTNVVLVTLAYFKNIPAFKEMKLEHVRVETAHADSVKYSWHIYWHVKVQSEKHALYITQQVNKVGVPNKYWPEKFLDEVPYSCLQNFRMTWINKERC